MAREGSTGLSAVTGWTGRHVIRIGTYPLDLGLFIVHSLHAWVRHGHFRNRATRRAAVGHILLTGINPLPATLIVALAVGFVFSLPLVPLAATIQEADLAAILLRLIALELAPLATAVVIIGRAGTAMATELGNMQLNGETAALKHLGIDVGDFFVAPRLLAGSIAQLVLATYFTAAALLGGTMLANLALEASAPGLATTILATATPMHLLGFIGKNLLFGLVIAGASCYSALQVRRNAVDVPFRVQRAITASLVLIFVLNGILALVWL